MVALFIEGFDKYGPANSNPNAGGLFTAGEWTSSTNQPALVAGLSATGYALSLTLGASLSKTLAANYTRLIGGVRFQPPVFTAAGVMMQFKDSATAQCTIDVNTSGVIELRTGTVSGTILNSGGSISVASTHYLEWDITFGASAAYQIWLDGVSLFSGTGATKRSSNSFANGILVQGNTLVLDDLYL